MSRVLRWAWRWKYTVVIPIALGVFLSVATYGYVPDQYMSQAVLVMDVRHRQVLPGESFVSQLPKENPVVKTELDIISSRNTAAHVMSLLADRGVDLVEPSRKINPVVLLVRSVVDMVGASIAAARSLDERPPEAAPAARDPRASLDDLLAGLRVSNDGRSYTIFIEYVSPDPVFAAEAANAFADAYLEKQVAIYDDAAARARDFLGPRVESLRAQLEETERRRQSRRRAAGLSPDGEKSLLVQRLADLSSELASVRAAIAEASARLDTARDATPAAGTSVDSPQIQALEAEKSRLERERANLVEQGALKSRDLSEIELGLGAVDEQIEEEFQRILGRLAQEIVVQERKKAILEAEIEKMREALERNASAVIEVAQLDREVEASSTIYESFLSRYKETIEQQGIAVPDARLISAAEPGTPDGGGRLAKWLIAGFVIGAAVGGTGALGRSALEARKASPEGVAAETGAAIFGFLPRLSAAKARRAGAAALDLRSAWGAALALIQMNSLLPLEDGSCSVVVVTSVAKGDGKTTVAIGLAQALAASGARALLIDCDARRPQIPPRLGLAAQAGRAGAAPDEAALSPETLQRAPWGCDVLSLADADAPRPFAFTGRRLKTLIKEARARYDVVILDSPAMGDHPEVTHLAAIADLAIHVVRWPRSRMSEVRFALGQLATVIPMRRVGVVFARLDRGCRQYRFTQRDPGQAREV